MTEALQIVPVSRRGASFDPSPPASPKEDAAQQPEASPAALPADSPSEKKQHRSNNFKYMERHTFDALFKKSISLLKKGCASGDPDDAIEALCALTAHYQIGSLLEDASQTQEERYHGR